MNSGELGSGEIDTYQAERAAKVRELFERCLATYNPEQLESGVYAETHGFDADIFTIMPYTESWIGVGTSEYNHSMWDEIRPMLGRGTNALWQEIPEIITLGDQLGLSQHSAKHRGLFKQTIDGVRSFCLTTRPDNFDEATFQNLKSNFGITTISLPSNVSSRSEYISLDFNKPPSVELHFSHYRLLETDRPSLAGREVGQTTLLNVFPPRWDNSHVSAKGIEWRRVCGMQLAVAAAIADTHPSLERSLLAELPEPDISRLSAIESTEVLYRHERDVLDLLSGTELEGSSFGPYTTRLMARHMIDPVSRDVELNVLINPGEHAKSSADLRIHLLAGMIISGYSQFLSNMGYGPLPLTASVMVNADAKSEMPVERSSLIVFSNVDEAFEVGKSLNKLSRRSIWSSFSPRLIRR
jgi:hypothetical protein